MMFIAQRVRQKIISVHRYHNGISENENAALKHYGID